MRSFNLLSVLVALGLLLVGYVQPAAAQTTDPPAVLVDAQPPTGMTGGGYHDPEPVPLSAQQEQELAQKHARLARITELKAKGYPIEQIWQALGEQPPATSAITPQGSSFGSCPMGLWKEPEQQPNWCGPGSATAVISNWRSVPPAGYGDAIAYMSYLATGACKCGETPPNCTGMMQGNLSSDSNWSCIVNREIGNNWYELTNPSTVGTYKGVLEGDIYWSGHPVNQLVESRDLPGWGSWSAPHWLAANQYDFLNNRIYYGDSAPNSASPYGDSFGWHWWNLDSFYQHIVDRGRIVLY